MRSLLTRATGAFKGGFSAAMAAGLLAATLAAPATAEERGPARRAHAAAEDGARVIVKYRADSALLRSAGNGEQSLQHAQLFNRRLGLGLRDGRAMGGRMQLMHASALSSEQLAARLSAQPEVEFAVPDRRRRAYAAPNDPLYADNQTGTPLVGQWYLRAPGNPAVAAINAEAAWAITTGTASVVVAVLDTGVRGNHPDLVGKLLPGYDFVADTAAANDGGGRDSDPSDPGDWISAGEDARGQFRGCGASDSSWHGTQTAGLVGAATNNGLGMAGAGYNLKVLPVRVLGKCGGFDSDIYDAMRWAAGLSVPGVPDNKNPARVINLSLGSPGSCDPKENSYQSVVDELGAIGVVVVAAAGNDGLPVGVPANCSGVVAVAGVRHAGTKVGYSNLGPQVTVAAPAGNCINLSGACLYPLLTTADSGSTVPAGSIYTDSFQSTLGTSFASPLVAATVGLMISANPSLTRSEVIGTLKSTARAFPQTSDDPTVGFCQAPSGVAQESECICTTATCGAGMLDAGAAVALASAVVARISVASSNAVAGSAVLLDGSGSTTSGSSISSWQWSITSGGGIAAFSSATNAANATLLPSAAGSVTVKLVVTDALGRSASSSTSLSIAAAPAASAASSGGSTSSSAGSSGSGSSSGGGGALGGTWLALLAAAVGALARSRRNA